MGLAEGSAALFCGGWCAPLIPPGSYGCSRPKAFERRFDEIPHRLKACEATRRVAARDEVEAERRAPAFRHVGTGALLIAASPISAGRFGR